jgi:hypothetical protein
MSYVKNSLLPNEEILTEGRTHWFTFLPGWVLVFAGFALWAAFGAWWWAPAAAAGGFWLAKAWLNRLGTEIVITSRRVIAKFGILRSRTMEFEHKNIESFLIDQSLLGRLLDYGTVVVHGMGGARMPLEGIAKPSQFRRAALYADERNAPAISLTAPQLNSTALGRDIVLQVRLDPALIARVRDLPAVEKDKSKRLLIEHDED